MFLNQIFYKYNPNDLFDNLKDFYYIFNVPVKNHILN